MIREKLVSTINGLNSRFHSLVVGGNIGEAERCQDKIRRMVSMVNSYFPDHNRFYQHRSGLAIEKITKLPMLELDTSWKTDQKKKKGPTYVEGETKPTILPLCLCGCGEQVKKFTSVLKAGHHYRVRKVFISMRANEGKGFEDLHPYLQDSYSRWIKSGKLILK